MEERVEDVDNARMKRGSVFMACAVYLGFCSSFSEAFGWTTS